VGGVGGTAVALQEEAPAVYRTFIALSTTQQYRAMKLKCRFTLRWLVLLFVLTLESWVCWRGFLGPAGRMLFY
jgi:hypothetical protein